MTERDQDDLLSNYPPFGKLTHSGESLECVSYPILNFEFRGRMTLEHFSTRNGDRDQSLNAERREAVNWVTRHAANA